MTISVDQKQYIYGQTFFSKRPTQHMSDQNIYFIKGISQNTPKFNNIVTTDSNTKIQM